MAKVIERIIDPARGRVTFRFPDGRELSIGREDLPDEMVNHLVAHGLSQKVGDAGSGKVTTNIDDAYEAMRKVANRLKAGRWSARQGGGGGKPFEATDDELVAAIVAIAAMRGEPADASEVRDRLADPDYRAAACADGAVRAMVRAARSANKKGGNFRP